jgi:peptidoglycan/LPS O-acetylase OafA/YrhL
MTSDGSNVSGLVGGPTERGYFRPDIEGLRAVAVLGVVLFHAAIPGAPGGFVGVDVFYVISGFLITGLLLREIGSSGGVSLTRFYARRLRRLLPAALLVIVLTLVASYWLLSSVRFPQVAIDGASAAAYVSNYRFALNATNYLAAGSEPSPLLHYWSLSLEEQFYLVWPLLIILASRYLNRAGLAVVLIAVTVVSCFASIWWTDIAQPWAFFSLPTRAWELAAGGLLAVSAASLAKRLPRSVMTASGLIGIGLVLGSFVVFNTSTPFPGTAAIVPVVGTVLIILAGESRSTVMARALGTRIPRWLGRISYSLYLWHWPLLILVPIFLGSDDLALRVVIVFVAIGISDLSTRWIEVPFREGRLLKLPPSRSILAAGSASACVAIIALSVGGGLTVGANAGTDTADLDLPSLAPLQPLPTLRPVAPTASSSGSLTATASPMATGIPTATTPTATPSTTPTATPSTTPTDLPAIPSPSDSVTPAETLASPTLAIPSPVMSASAQPAPSVQPTPSASPTTGPSSPSVPTSSPTLASTPSPSPPATPFPTTPSPSISSPTPSPSISLPSPAPPPRPTLAPTPSPSLSPPPTPSPSPEPTATVPPPPLPDPLISGPLPKNLVPSLADAANDLPVSYSDGCHLDFGTTESPPCVYGDPNSPTTAILFGDSHAAQWLPALQRIAAANDWRLESLTKSGCPPVPLTVWNAPLNRSYRECDQWRRNALQRIEAEHPAYLFVASARDYQVVDDQGNPQPFDASLPQWSDALEHVLTRLHAAAERTVMFAETPRFDTDPVECLARHARVDACTDPASQHIDADYSQLESTAASAASVDLISANDWLCPDGVCPLVMGRYLIYRDTTHVTATFMEILAARLEWALASLP